VPAIIADGKVILGINDAGNLNVVGGAPSATHGGGSTTDVGMRFVPADGGGAEFEATSHGFGL